MNLALQALANPAQLTYRLHYLPPKISSSLVRLSSLDLLLSSRTSQKLCSPRSTLPQRQASCPQHAGMPTSNTHLWSCKLFQDVVGVKDLQYAGRGLAPCSTPELEGIPARVLLKQPQAAACQPGKALAVGLQPQGRPAPRRQPIQLPKIGRAHV